jgi:RNA polymerase-associated protein CTR9
MLQASLANQSEMRRNVCAVMKRAQCCSVRLGIGLCYNKLGKLDLAKLGFERALELDSHCVEAMIGLAVLELNSEGLKKVQAAVKLMRTAFDISPYNAMVRNYLADHLFYKGEFAKARECERNS